MPCASSRRARRRTAAALIASVDALRGLGLSASGALEEIASLLQQMAVVQAVPEAADESDPDGAVVARLAALLPADETQLLYSIALQGRAELVLAPDEYSGLVMVLLRMLAFAPRDAAAVPPTPKPRPAVPVAAREKAAEPVVAEQQRVEPVRVATVEAAAATRSPIDEATGRVAADRWVALVHGLAADNAVSAMVRELAMQAECVAVSDDGDVQVWRLRVERENLRAPALRERLQAAAAQSQGRAVRLDVEAGAAADTAAARDAAERALRQAEAERVIHDDPLVKALMAQYKTARIVPGSVKPHR